MERNGTERRRHQHQHQQQDHYLHEQGRDQQQQRQHQQQHQQHQQYRHQEGQTTAGHGRDNRAELMPVTRGSGAIRTAGDAAEGVASEQRRRAPPHLGAAAGGSGMARNNDSAADGAGDNMDALDHFDAGVGIGGNLDESFSSRFQSSLPTVRSSSWDDASDDERFRARSNQHGGGDADGSGGLGGRKYDNAATPTLMDEDDYAESHDLMGMGAGMADLSGISGISDSGHPDSDELEMISLALDPASIRSRDAFSAADQSSLRRTPGARMYKSALRPIDADDASASLRQQQQHHHGHAHGQRQGQGHSHHPQNQQAQRQQQHQQHQHHHHQQRSQIPVVAPKPTPLKSQVRRDASGLGFGLTLSTPVTASTKTSGIPSGVNVEGMTPPTHGSGATTNSDNRTTSSAASAAWNTDQRTASSTSTNTSSGTPQTHKVIGGRFGQRDSSSTGRQPQQQQQQQQRQSNAFAPTWAMKGDERLEARRDSYSPNTLRLTADLGSLLLDDDDAAASATASTSAASHVSTDFTKRSAFRPNTGSRESWTSTFVIGRTGKSGGGNQRDSRSSFSSHSGGGGGGSTSFGAGGRNRRGRNDSSRRQRNNDRASHTSRSHSSASSSSSPSVHPGPTAPNSGFVPLMQPAANRLQDGQSPFVQYGTRFPYGDSNQQAARNMDGSTQAPSPHLINFGGSFTPTSEHAYMAGFARPIPAAALPPQSNMAATNSAFQPALPHPGMAPRQSPFPHHDPFRASPMLNPQQQQQQQVQQQASMNAFMPSDQQPQQHHQLQHHQQHQHQHRPGFPAPQEVMLAAQHNMAPSPNFGFTPDAVVMPYAMHPQSMSGLPPAPTPPPQSQGQAQGQGQSHAHTHAQGHGHAHTHTAHPHPHGHAPAQMQPPATDYMPHPVPMHHQPQQGSGPQFGFAGQQSVWHQPMPQAAQRGDFEGINTMSDTTAFNQGNWKGSNRGWETTGEIRFGQPPHQQQHGQQQQQQPTHQQQQQHGQQHGQQTSQQGFHANLTAAQTAQQQQHQQSQHGQQHHKEPSQSQSQSQQNLQTQTQNPSHPVPNAGANPFAVALESSKNQRRPRADRGSRSGGKNRGRNQRKGSARRGGKSQHKSDRHQQRDNDSEQTTHFSGKKSPALHSKSKKKTNKDRSTSGASSTSRDVTGTGARPGSSNANSNSNTGDNATGADAKDDPSNQKRAELNESQATKLAFRDFYRKFRTFERTSSQAAEEFAIKTLNGDSLPQQVHWRLYLELADLSKRTNRFTEARQLYQKVCELQPYANQGWLEYSKLEEECGNMSTCSKILNAGLEYCEYNENLLIRAIKHKEKMGDLPKARELLARLKHVGIEKVWRTVLEGALLEARAGNTVMARRVLKYIMHHIQWYGPLYLEAYRLEKDLGRHKEALMVVNKGLATLPKYGPLWFGAFRLCEAMDLDRKDFNLSQSMAMIDKATNSISKELIWKVHLEAAQILERCAVEHLSEADDATSQGGETIQDYHVMKKQLMAKCRQRFAMTIFTCPPNLRWKVWLAAGRMELAAGRPDVSRKLFLRAHKVVPDKGRAVALLEWARLEEFVGDNELASAILCKSRSVSGSDWKVWFESVLLEIRRQDHSTAVELARHALRLHSGTGRLWASLVQLCHFDGGEEAQIEALKGALNAVPKSGEVWCEGSRIHLNPFSRTFDIVKARRHLYFATRFTPQYGDGFLETLRLEILDQWLLPVATIVWESTLQKFRTSPDLDTNAELVTYLAKVHDAIHHLFSNTDTSQAVQESSTREFIDGECADIIRGRLGWESNENMLDTSNLELRCANADPNYGSLWFHCRDGPTDTARRVLAKALEIMMNEMRSTAIYYVVAFVRRYALREVFERGQKLAAREASAGRMVAPALQDIKSREDAFDELLLSFPTLQDVMEVCAIARTRGNEQDGMMSLEGIMTGSDFVTGLIKLNRQTPMNEMTLSQRKKALFGTDALFP